VPPAERASSADAFEFGDHVGVRPERSNDPAAFHDADAVFAARTLQRGDVPLHAASIEVDGTIVAFAGESGAGKSTLAAAAVQVGHSYVADEITAITSEGLRVSPYHRSIGLRSGGSDALGIDFPDDRRTIPGAVQAWPVTDPRRRSDGGPLAGIFLVRWRPGSAHLDDVDPPQALVELTQHIVVDDDRFLAATFRTLEALVRSVPVRRLIYGDPAEGVGHVEREVETWSA
jgi:energy-coupling factor transporter ATP-binding protein EcfA2